MCFVVAEYVLVPLQIAALSRQVQENQAAIDAAAASKRRRAAAA